MDISQDPRVEDLLSAHDEADFWPEDEQDKAAMRVAWLLDSWGYTPEQFEDWAERRRKRKAN